MPKGVTTAKLKKEEVKSKEVEKGMLALNWMDKRQVNMLSTIHDDSMMSKHRRTQHVPGEIKEVQKPVIVEQYRPSNSHGLTMRPPV